MRFPFLAYALFFFPILSASVPPAPPCLSTLQARVPSQVASRRGSAPRGLGAVLPRAIRGIAVAYRRAICGISAGCPQDIRWISRCARALQGLANQGVLPGVPPPPSRQHQFFRLRASLHGVHGVTV